MSWVLWMTCSLWPSTRCSNATGVPDTHQLGLSQPLFTDSRDCHMLPWPTVRSPKVAHWCFWTVVLEKTLKSPLDCEEIKLINPKGNQFWIFIRRTDAEAEAPILWPPDVKNWLTGKDPDAGKDWRQEKKGLAEDEMVRWHHGLNGHEPEQALRVGDG